MPQRIAIVGGGIAGLALAGALDPRRFEVELYEAEPRRAGDGALGMWPSALRALERLGVRASVEVAGGRPTVGAMHTMAGERLTGGRDIDVLMVPRAALLAALADALPSSVQVRHEQVSDPQHLDADVVVGADGVRSKVRGLVHPAGADRAPTPYVALRGLIDREVPDAVVGEYWGPQVLFGILPTSPGTAYWYTSHRSDLDTEPLCASAVLTEFQERTQGAAPVVSQTLADPGDRVNATRVWTAPAMPRYVRGRYVVIGDAAHAMTPNLGRGACDAIVDSVTLADALATGRLLRWQARRVPATQATRFGSSQLMRLALLQRGHRVRNNVLGRLPG